MPHRAGLRQAALLAFALLLGCGWSLGSALGLHGDQWFSEPEARFELLVALGSALCGALLAYASGKGTAWQATGLFAGGGFALALIGYCRYSIGLPSADLAFFAAYLRALLAQTFGMWIALLSGAAVVALLRVILA